MDKCEHIWQGDCRGVVCTICGKKITHAEYRKLSHRESRGNADERKTELKADWLKTGTEHHETIQTDSRRV